MSLKFIFTTHPSLKTIAVNQSFASEHWGVNSHEGDVRLDFFAKPDYLAQLFFEDRLVSSLVLFIRQLDFQGKKYTFVGIGGVVTHIDYRHRGFATKLLQKSLAKVSNCDFALLATDVDKIGPLYERVGFVALDRPYLFLDKNGLKKPDPGGMIAPLSSPEAVDSILHSPTEIFVGASAF